MDAGRKITGKSIADESGMFGVSFNFVCFFIYEELGFKSSLF